MKLSLIIILAFMPIGFGLNMKDDDFLFGFGQDIAAIKRSIESASKVQPTGGSHQRSMSALQSVQNVFGKLKGKMDAVKNPTPAMKNVFDNLNSKAMNLTAAAGEENLKKLQDVTASMEKNWDDLTGTDSLKIATAVVDLVGTVAGFIPPPVGTIASTILGLASNIMGMFGEKEKSVGEILQDVIKKELRELQISQMTGEIRGALIGLKSNQAGLNTFPSGPMSQRLYEWLLTQFSYLHDLELRAKLMNLIDKTAKAKTKEEALDSFALIRGYTTLTTMLEMLMHKMKSILEDDGEASVQAMSLAASIAAARKQVGDDFEFLRKPKMENALLIAHYYTDKSAFIEKILDDLEVKSDLALNGCYKLISKKLNYKVRTSDNQLIGSKEKEGDTFQFIKNEYGWCIKTGPFGVIPLHDHKYKSFITAENCTLPFRIHAFTDGGYMITNQAWPGDPLWMALISWSQFVMMGNPLAEWGGYVTARDKTWDPTNPQYVWLLSEVKC